MYDDIEKFRKIYELEDYHELDKSQIILPSSSKLDHGNQLQKFNHGNIQILHIFKHNRFVLHHFQNVSSKSTELVSSIDLLSIFLFHTFVVCYIYFLVIEIISHIEISHIEIVILHVFLCLDFVKGVTATTEDVRLGLIWLNLNYLMESVFHTEMSLSRLKKSII